LSKEPDLTPTSTTANGALLPPEDPVQAGKIHVRGVDDMATKDIVAFATEHFPNTKPSGRIEWIDDTSANIPYESADLALEALRSFVEPLPSDFDISQLQMLPAKPSSTHPSASLQVRLAVQSDRKKPRAHEASRFYMMHPEHDPRERLRKEFSQRKRSGRRGEGEDYNRRRYDDREHRRRKEENGDDFGFDANMYDDAPDTRDTSRSSEKRNQRRSRRDSGDLFSSREDTRGRLRNRSASPARNRVGDEDVDFTEDRRRFRKRTPPPDYSTTDPYPFPRENFAKELFPTQPKEVFPTSKPSPKTPTPEPPKELFPGRLSPPKTAKKELFPTRTPHSHHRRSDAFDAADETADLFSKRLSVPFVDGSTETSRPRSSNTDGINIRGSAQDQGMSIRGSGGITIKGSAGVKELFPGKAGNVGKELFSEKLEGRGGNRRRKAEDLFY
jgi:hypothetical protein